MTSLSSFTKKATARLWGRRGRRIPFGRGNWLEVADGSGMILATRLRFARGARDNVVSVGPDFDRGELKVTFRGRNNRLIVGGGVRWAGKIHIEGARRSVTIGDGCFARKVEIVARDADVEIGPDCLFSHSIEIRSSDSHHMFDMETGEKLNEGEAVRIGEHVWIGARAYISKGATVADGSVVGACSLVNKRFEVPNVALGGVPAKVLRGNVRWSR